MSAEAGAKRDNGAVEGERESPSKKVKDGEGHKESSAKPKHSLYPYLYFRGNCKEAVDFYAHCFDAEVPLCKTFKEGPPGGDAELGDWIMHAMMQFGNNTIMFSDSKDFVEGSNIHLCISCDTVETLNTAFDRLSNGGKVTMPVAQQFWGATFGSLTDKFGVNWMFNCDN
jgi:PhnB protein